MTWEEKAERNALMREYKAEGHTMQEVADKFGVTKGHTQRVCKGIAPQSGAAKGRPNPNKGILKDEHKVKEFVESRVKGVEYFGNYTGADGRVDLRCKECGTVFNRSMISVRKGHCSCPSCREKKLSESRKQKETRDNRMRTERAKRKMAAEANKQKFWRQIRVASCECCGNVFYTTNSKQKYCSDSCRKLIEKRYASYNRGSDDRLNSRNIVDTDISLEKLFLRDNGVCQICGGLCDYNDCYTNENGTFIAGGLYPSRDHIVPLSKGGKHSWDNVRLAHRRCNSKIFWELQRFDPSLVAKTQQNP